MGAAVLSQVLARSEVRRRVREAPHMLVDHSVVTLVGTVRAIGEPLIAPLSGRACVVHRSTARGGDSSFTQCELVRFTLVTRDGEVIVDGETAEIPDRPSPIIPRKLEREEAFLARHGYRGGRGTGFEEIVIEPGARVSVHGVVRVEISPPAARGEIGFRDAPTIVRIVGDARNPLTIVPS
jgi:hypothetical protein